MWYMRGRQKEAIITCGRRRCWWRWLSPSSTVAAAAAELEGMGVGVGAAIAVQDGNEGSDMADMLVFLCAATNLASPAAALRSSGLLMAAGLRPAAASGSASALGGAARGRGAVPGRAASGGTALGTTSDVGDEEPR